MLICMLREVHDDVQLQHLQLLLHVVVGKRAAVQAKSMAMTRSFIWQFVPLPRNVAHQLQSDHGVGLVEERRMVVAMARS